MVQTIEKSMKSIKLFSIFALVTLLVSCSSGGSDAIGGLNLSGRWVGTVTFTAAPAIGGEFGATLQISQERVISPGTESALADFNLTVRAVRGGFTCVYVLNVDNATIFGRTNTISAVDRESSFIGNVSNSEINGDFNFDIGSDDGPACGAIAGAANFRRA